MSWEIVTKFLSRKLGAVLLGVFAMLEVDCDGWIKAAVIGAIIIVYVGMQAIQNIIGIWKTGTLLEVEEKNGVG